MSGFLDEVFFLVEIWCPIPIPSGTARFRRRGVETQPFISSPDFQGTENTTSGLTAIRTQPIPVWMRSFFGVLSTTTLKALRYRTRFRRRGVETKDHFKEHRK